MKDFVRPPFDRLLEAMNLTDFEALWALERDWFEPPNVRRGGWSGVCRKACPDPDSPTGETVYFCKVQENHMRRPWHSPLRGEATFVREAKNLLHFERHGVAAPQLVYFAQRVARRSVRAILITRGLDGGSLQRLVRERAPGPEMAVRLGALLHQLHEKAGYVHRSLELKHIHVDGDRPLLMDLKRAAPRLRRGRPAITDLEKLFRQMRKEPLIDTDFRMGILRTYLALGGRGAELDRWARHLRVSVPHKSLRTADGA